MDMHPQLIFALLCVTILTNTCCQSIETRADSCNRCFNSVRPQAACFLSPGLFVFSEGKLSRVKYCKPMVRLLFSRRRAWKPLAYRDLKENFGLGTD